jgi:hypothetical protein
MHTNPNFSIREHILNVSQKLLFQKRSTVIFLRGYKQFSNLVSNSSCVEEGILTYALTSSPLLHIQKLHC